MKSEPDIKLVEKQDFQLSGNFHFFQVWFWTRLDVLFLQLWSMILQLYLRWDWGPWNSQHLLPQGPCFSWTLDSAAAQQPKVFQAKQSRLGYWQFLLALDNYFLIHEALSLCKVLLPRTQWRALLSSPKCYLYPPNLYHLCSEHTEVIKGHNKIEINCQKHLREACGRNKSSLLATPWPREEWRALGCRYLPGEPGRWPLSHSLLLKAAMKGVFLNFNLWKKKKKKSPLELMLCI